jgi:hypothetical protein
MVLDLKVLIPIVNISLTSGEDRRRETKMEIAEEESRADK